MSAEGHAVAAAGQDAYVRRAASVDARAGKERSREAGRNSQKCKMFKSQDDAQISGSIWNCRKILRVIPVFHYLDYLSLPKAGWEVIKPEH